ncbi:MAG: serine/threonine protein kinase, partial [Nocardiopsaceae bacterium]|nr:serine/threonine protein kinase [Nocardiopsaceae bacterium]
MPGDPSTRGRRLLDAFGPGTRVAAYRLEAPLGAGGMGAVFRAHDEPLDREVALKVVYAGGGIDQTVRERFVREALSIAKVDHPHIIPIYAAGEDGDVMYIAMRYSSGGDLRSRIYHDGPFTPARAAAVISPVASALDAAHECGLVHRDVKPANILADDGHGRRPVHVYLSDFGLATGILADSGLTGDGQFVGTPDYAAPEQIKGAPTDGRADQYSLAGVAYTVLTGQLPYVRENPMAVLYAHMDAPPPSVTMLRPDLPPAVDQVLAKGMAKEPGYRFSSCAEFADALRGALGIGPYDTALPLPAWAAPQPTMPAWSSPAAPVAPAAPWTTGTPGTPSVHPAPAAQPHPAQLPQPPQSAPPQQAPPQQTPPPPAGPQPVGPGQVPAWPPVPGRPAMTP